MGQLLIVLGKESPAVRSLFEKGCRLFSRVSRRQPSGRMIRGALAIATFPPLKAPAMGIVRESGTGSWLASAGSWFYDRQFREDGARQREVAVFPDKWGIRFIVIDLEPAANAHTTSCCGKQWHPLLQNGVSLSILEVIKGRRESC